MIEDDKDDVGVDVVKDDTDEGHGEVDLVHA